MLLRDKIASITIDLHQCNGHQNPTQFLNQSTDSTGKWLASLFGASKFHILKKSTFYGMIGHYLSLPVIHVYVFSKNWAKNSVNSCIISNQSIRITNENVNLSFL